VTKEESLKKEFTSSFGLISAAELRVFRSCVCFGFLGLEQSSLAPESLAFGSGLFQLSRVNRELAYSTPFAH
jgi:hypothetical protein